MELSRDRNSKLGLLVSVRDLAEARLVASVGVDILDVKEPLAGALGRADEQVIAGVVAELAAVQKISAALGELDECEQFLQSGQLPAQLSFAKCGLAQAEGRSWKSRIAAVWEALKQTCQPVAVAYADHELCDAPAPLDIMHWAVECGLNFFLLDTSVKGRGSSLDVMAVADLKRLCGVATENGIQVVLAGGLQVSDLGTARAVGADLVGVRGAVCAGSREQGIAVSKVELLQQMVAADCNNGVMTQ